MVQNAKSNNKGFTIIEALIAMTIFALILIFMAQSILLTYKINFLNSVKNTAWQIASNELENIRNMQMIYDINDDGNFVEGVDEDGDGNEDYGTDCPSPCTTNPTVSQCKTTVRIRSKNVVFGKSVDVEKDGDIYKITITVCTDYLDLRTKQPLKVSLTTLIAGE